MRDPDKPSPRRKARAGVTIVALVFLIILVTFVGMNIGHAQVLDRQQEAPGQAQTKP
ncbi:hypothetical protein [Amaricoccus solimangrovi]|uniref:hypothetical protein n=1 Tax=Amaricoccus solimangrovi TaxID=2589815 RepID=UPI0015E2D7D6|nr:hypothetical protein [Amaricoccus solimangrovi]